ncbi:MAG: cytoplasmic protein [Clostridia bacterium]|nr:cytoplasmic protein [Clostridia bacterium]
MITDISLAHEYSKLNKEEILKSKKCGCFYCGKIFDKNLIVNWLKDSKEETALCPFCQIDSVLPDSKVEITKEFLKNMHKTWFK